MIGDLDPVPPAMRPDPEPGLTIVVHSGTLGDWVLALPILRALAACGPVWAVTTWSAARLAARRVAGVAAVDGDQPRWARLYAPTPPADDELAARLAAAVRIVSFVAGPGDAWAANVAAAAPRARLAFASPRPPGDWPGHATAWYAACLAPLGLPPHEPPPAPPDVRRGAPGGPILLHPGSGAAAKCWPAERFWALGQSLAFEGRRVQVVLGEAERARWREAEIRRWRAAFDVRLPETLGALEEALHAAAAYVGNDSGPTHLAAELGLPTVALFGPTLPLLWRPNGARVTVLAPPTPAAMDWLPLDPVIAAVRAALDP